MKNRFENFEKMETNINSSSTKQNTKIKWNLKQILFSGTEEIQKLIMESNPNIICLQEKMLKENCNITFRLIIIVLQLVSIID